MPKKGSAKFSALKGAVQGTLSHRGSADHSPRGKMQNIVPQKGSAPKKGSAEHSSQKGSAQVPKRDSAEQSAPEGQCPKGAVQSTVHKCPSAQCTVTKKCTVPKKGRAEYSPGGAVRTQPQGQCREKRERRAVASSSA